MKIVIVGGTGLIGRTLAADLLGAGHQVRVLSRGGKRSADLPPAVQITQWDAENVDALKPLLDGVDAVVQLAGAGIGDGRWTADRKRLIRDSRVRSSGAIAVAIVSGASPRVLVQGSAVGYYGARGDEEIDEGSAAGDDFLSHTCQAWEEASAAVETSGVRRAIARTGVVLSVDGGALPRMALPFKLFAGGPAGGGRQWLPWIHLADEVAALRFLIESDEARGPFNLTSPNPLTNKEFSRVLGRVLRRPSFLPAPAFALKLALGEMSTLVLDGQRALPSRLGDLGFAFHYPDAESALRQLYGRS